MPVNDIEVHDPKILANARAILDACQNASEMQQAVLDAVKRNETWRGQQCINLLAPEAPTSPTVRALLGSEIGTRAAEGNIGSVQRWFAGTQHIDEVEALCVELLKQAFRCRYADHRLMGSMLGNMAVYYAMAEPGDVIMTVPQPFGGHSSNRYDGPAGQRGLKIVDVPFDPIELTGPEIWIYFELAPLVKPKLVTLGLSMTLFPQPVREMKEVLQEWGGKLFFDGAHQAGWNRRRAISRPVGRRRGCADGFGGQNLWRAAERHDHVERRRVDGTDHARDFSPVLAATHQVNRVAALAVAAAEMIAFGDNFIANDCGIRASVGGRARSTRHSRVGQAQGLHDDASSHRGCRGVGRRAGSGALAGAGELDRSTRTCCRVTSPPIGIGPADCGWARSR